MIPLIILNNYYNILHFIIILSNYNIFSNSQDIFNIFIYLVFFYFYIFYLRLQNLFHLLFYVLKTVNLLLLPLLRKKRKKKFFPFKTLFYFYNIECRYLVCCPYLFLIFINLFHILSTLYSSRYFYLFSYI